jgi:putative transposase
MASTFTHLIFHVVFSTKERRKLITPELQTNLYPYMGGITRQEKASLLAIGGVADHVHLLLRTKPDIALADLLRILKANSSKWAKEQCGMREWFGWQTGYGAFTVSKTRLEDVRSYIEHQAEHHHKRTFQEEFLQMLKAHDIEYDPRYVWD